MRTLLCSLFLLIAVAAHAQSPDIVNALKVQRAAKPTPMTKAQLSDMLNRAALQVPGWAMLRKDGGNNCPTPYPNIFISCDWLFNVAAQYGWDFVVDGENAAVIEPNNNGALQPGQELVMPWPVDGQPQDPQQPQQPTTGVTLDQIRAAIRQELAWSVNPGGPEWERNEERFTSKQEMEQANHLAIMGRFSELQADINNPGWIRKHLPTILKWATPIVGGILGQKYLHLFGNSSPAPTTP